MPLRPTLRTGASGKEVVVHSYAAVYVLFLNWAEDDLGVNEEIVELAGVFEQAYGFLVQRALIPTNDPDEALAKSVKMFVQTYQHPRSLLIVYYAGHGGLNESRLAQWYCNSSRNSAVARWYSHQRYLEDSTADVLLILDCCQPLGGGGSVRAATGKQVLAACGFGRDAPGVGQHSFTRALIEEMMKSVLHPFTTSELHHRVMNNLRTMVPDHHGERRETPVLAILGEGGFPSPSIRLASYAAYPTNLVALMGMTGSGKSSLINRICGRNIAEVGQSLESKTKDVIHYNAVVNGETITLIDTPGFDDTYLTDRQVLERIATYLFEHWQTGRKLTGLLYLRDINLDKMTGSARKNLDMFVRLCGESSLGNVILATTKWDTVRLEVAQDREKELINNFWAGMIKSGCSQPVRIGARPTQTAGIADPIKDIVGPIFKKFKPTFLQIQRELGNGKDLIQTAAGKYIDQSLDGQIESLVQATKAVAAEAKQAKLKPVKEALVEQVKQNQDDITGAEQDRDALREDFEKVRAAEAERRQQLFGLGLLSRLDEYAADLEVDDKEVRAFMVLLPSYGLYKAFKYIWKKQGKAKELLEGAKKDLRYMHG